MDTREPRLISPSLLDDGKDAGVSTPFAAPNPLDGVVVAPRRASRSRWMLVIVLLAVAAVGLLKLGGAFDGSRHDAAGIASTPALVSAAADAAGMTLPPAPDAAGASRRSVAVILPAPEVAAVAASASAPLVPAALASKEASKPGPVFNPSHRSAPVAAPSPRSSSRREVDGSDSDVALLTALLRHVEAKRGAAVLPVAARPVSIEAKMRACPAANTAAGVQCRQKVCEGRVGKVAACPASIGGA